MNIGIGLILLSVALLFLASGMFLRKKRKKMGSNSLLIVGTLILSASLALLTGLYDPMQIISKNVLTESEEIEFAVCCFTYHIW
ncbi:hypothetical protein AB3N02_00375 [Priestia aryabhattai]